MPLLKLTSTKVSWRWTDLEQESFQKIKKALTEAPMLVAPDFSKPFQVYCDASKLGGAMGAVLQQNHGVIAYASKHFKGAQENYTINEKEALAILWSAKHFKDYIYGQKVTFYTDHKPLADLKDNHAPEESLGRLMLKLQGMNYEIKYVRGIDNTVADLLSRDCQRLEETNTTPIDINTIQVELIDWASEQNKDPEIRQAIAAVLQSNRSMISAELQYFKMFSHLKVTNGVLYYDNRVVVPVEARLRELAKNHNYYGHEQTNKLYKRLHWKFFWPKMKDDVKEFVRTCDVCQRTKTRHLDSAELSHIVDLDKIDALGFWSIDLQGPFCTSKSGNRYIIVAIDYATKFVEAAATKDATALTTAKFILNNIILRHGVPKGMSLLSDQGKNFESKLIKELCDLYGITKLRSSPYHPAGNGAVERENRSIKEALRSYTLHSQREWDEFLAQIISARNTTVHTTTGFLPYEMLYARKPDQPTPSSLINVATSSEYVAKLKAIKNKIAAEAVKNIRREREKLRKRNRGLRNRTKYQFSEGQEVFITNEANHPGLTKKTRIQVRGSLPSRKEAQ